MFKVLHVSNTSFDKFNGIATVVPQLVGSQNIDKISEAILVGTKKSSRTFAFSLLYSSSLLSFFKILKKQKPDIVVFHDLYDLKYIYYSLIALLLRIPYIIVPHSCLSISAQNKGKLKKTVANYTLWFPMLIFSRAIAFLNNGEMENSLFRWKKSIIVSNGIENINSEDRIIDDKKIRIVYLGRIDIHHKGLDLLLRALVSIKTKLIKRNASFIIYGNSVKQGKNLASQDEILIKMVNDFELKEIVTLHEPVYNEQKKQVFLNSDIMILTSRYEGMPMSILEALSFGIPVIITKETNMADLVIKFNSGWVVNKEPNEMSDQILSAIDNYVSNKEQYNKNAILTANELLWPKIAADSIDKYKELLK